MATMTDLKEFAPDSKIWVFTANRKMTDAEIRQIDQKLDVFCRSWTSHSNKLHAEAFVLHGYFIILAVDNKDHLASGCSIDTAMRFIQTLQIDFDIDLLDRESFVYLKDDQPQLVRKDQLAGLIQSGTVSDDTMFYDPLVATWEEMQAGFIKPMGSFWMKNMA